MTNIIFVLSFLAGAMLSGLIWCVQIVHYPTFSYVNRDQYREFQKFHEFRISFVVVPLMIIELGSSIILYLSTQENKFASGMWVAISVMIWLLTFLVSSPLHYKLGKGFDEKIHQRLVLTNLPRTLLWTTKTIWMAITLCKIH